MSGSVGTSCPPKLLPLVGNTVSALRRSGPRSRMAPSWSACSVVIEFSPKQHDATYSSDIPIFSASVAQVSPLACLAASMVWVSSARFNEHLLVHGSVRTAELDCSVADAKVAGLGFA